MDPKVPKPNYETLQYLVALYCAAAKNLDVEVEGRQPSHDEKQVRIGAVLTLEHLVRDFAKAYGLDVSAIDAARTAVTNVPKAGGLN